MVIYCISIYNDMFELSRGVAQRRRAGYSSKGVLRIIIKKAALKSLLTEEPLLVNGKKP